MDTLDYLYERFTRYKGNISQTYFKKVQQLVNILSTKINYLPEEYQEDTLKLVKGMAYISLREQGQGLNKGISIEALLEGVDLSGTVQYVLELISRLQVITGGQFIERVGKDNLRLDPVHCLDYDQIIEEKASMLSHRDEIRRLACFLKKAFGLDEGQRITENPANTGEGYAEIGDNFYYDYFSWPDHNSYQKALVNISAGIEYERNKLPLLIINLNFFNNIQKEGKDGLKGNPERVILNIDYGPPLAELLRKLIVVDNYTDSSNYPSSYLNWKKKVLSGRVEEGLVKILNNSLVIYPNRKVLVSELDAHGKNLKNIYWNLKQKLFTDIFEKYFSLHPVFSLKLDENNITEIAEETIISLLTGKYDSSSRRILKSLKLLVKNDNLDISTSPYIQKLLQFLQEADEEVVPVSKLYTFMEGRPYGLQRELIYLLLVVLLYLGVISLYRKDKIKFGGLKELKSIFLHKRGLFPVLDKLEVIGFVELLERYSLDNQQRLFSVLGVQLKGDNSGYKPLLVYKEYNRKIEGIKTEIKRAQDCLGQYLVNPVPGISRDLIKDKITYLDKPILKRLFTVNSISDLQKLKLDDFELEELDITLAYIINLVSFLDYFDQHIIDKYRQCYQMSRAEQNDKKMKELESLVSESWQRIDNKEILIKLKEYLS